MAQNSLVFNFVGVDKGVSKTVDRISGKIGGLTKRLAVGAAAGAVAFAAQGVRSFLKFDDAMTQSLAIMGDVSGPMRKRMEDAARAVGKTTRFGAEQAAESYFFLASAGLDAEQSIAALPQVASFAQAGMFDLARATDLATDAQSALGLTVKDPAKNLQNLTRVTDVLVKANTLANASVEQFSTSLTNKAGSAARTVGKDIEETTAVLAAFADQGIKGEEAGTQFAIVLRDLQTKAIANKDAFEEAGLAVFDSSGEMRNMGDIVADLENLLGGMTDEQKKATLAMLGFSDRSVGVLQTLLGTSDAIKRYEQELRNAAGTTEDVAGKQLESFAARLDLIKSKVADTAISLGSVLVNAAFNVGETVAEMARIFGDLPGPVQAGTLAIAGIVTAAPLAVGAYKKVKGAIDAVRIAYGAMTTAGKVATLSLGAVGVALAAGTAILGFFARQNLESKARVDELTASLDKQTGAITENTREIAAKQLADSGALEAAKTLGLDLERVTDAYLGNKKAVAEVQAELQNYNREAGIAELVTFGLTTILDENDRAQRKLNEALGEGNTEIAEAQRQHQLQAEAVGEATSAEEEMSTAVESATGLVDEQASAIDDLTSELDELTKSVFAARDAEVDYEQAVDDAKAALKENGETLDVNTQKGRDNRKALDNLARSALDQAAAMLQNGASHDKTRGKMESARKQFIKTARQMGLSAKAADKLADELGLIPGNYKATVTANTSSASRAIANVRSQLLRLPSQKTIRIVGETSGITGGVFRQHGGPVERNQFAVVGEKGPELVRFSQPGMVFSHEESRRLLRNGGGSSLGGGGSTTVQLINQGVIGSQREMERWLAESVNRLRRTGRLN